MSIRLRSKSNLNFAVKLLSVFDAVLFEDGPFLTHLRVNKKGDEFDIRDKIAIPLLEALGYDRLTEMTWHKTRESGIPDIIVRNQVGAPLIVMETLPSNAANPAIEEHRSRLMRYQSDPGVLADFAILTNGDYFWVYSNRQPHVLHFAELYRRFQSKGVSGLADRDIEAILCLRALEHRYAWLDKSLLLKDPEYDIKRPEVLDDFLDELRTAMADVREDANATYDEFASVYKEYEAEEAKWKAKGGLYPSKRKTYEPAIRWNDSIQRWKAISSPDPAKARDLFLTETMYVLVNRLLLIRICEDRGIIRPRKLSNGAIQAWITFKGYLNILEANFGDLLEEARRDMEAIYPHLFNLDIFDWYKPTKAVSQHLLYLFNRFNFSNIDRDVIGHLYEQYLDREERKRLGQFYTPVEVVDYILDAVGYKPDEPIEGKLLLDPACGSGTFLVRAASRLIERLRSKGLDAESVLAQVQGSIFGLDINPFAAHLAETNLLFLVVDLIAEARKRNPEFVVQKFNIYETDTLQDQPQVSAFETQAEEDFETVRHVKERGGRFRAGFDFIVGNPPYGDILKSDFKKQLLMKFSYVSDYEISQFFIGLCSSLLKGQGSLGFIIPNTLFLNVNAKRFRMELVTHYQITRFVNLSQISVFIDPKVRNVIFAFCKIEDGSPDLNVNIIGLVGTDISQGSIKASIVSEIPQGRLVKDDREWLRLMGTLKASSTFLEKIEAHPLLMSLADVSQGLIPYDKYRGHSEETIKKRIWHAPSQRDETYRRELRGEDVGRYSLSWNGNQWISYGDWLAAPREPRFFRNPRVLIREVTEQATGLINATYTEEEYYNTPSIINVVRKKDSDVDLHYLLALINSRLLAFYHKNRSPKAQKGLFPKILVEDVRKFPIPSASPQVKEVLISLALGILRLNSEIPELVRGVADFVGFAKGSEVKSVELPASPLAVDCSEIRDLIGKPKVRVDQGKVYADNKSYFSVAHPDIGRYLSLYLSSLLKDESGMRKSDLLAKVLIPNTLEDVFTVLSKHHALGNEIEAKKLERDRLDRELDDKVYTLYGLTLDEINLVKELT